MCVAVSCCMPHTHICIMKPTLLMRSVGFICAHAAYICAHAAYSRRRLLQASARLTAALMCELIYQLVLVGAAAATQRSCEICGSCLAWTTRALWLQGDGCARGRAAWEESGRTLKVIGSERAISGRLDSMRRWLCCGGGGCCCNKFVVI